MTGWLEIRAEGGRETKDLAAFTLIDAGSPAVVENDDPRADHNPAAALTAYLPAIFPHETGPLKKRLGKIGWSFTLSTYTDTDWAEKWKRHIRPVRAARFLVKPTWSRVKKRPGEISIEIDPGMAFGTGSHATTRMCLKAVYNLVKGKSGKAGLLDVGTGSGILAIAAKKLGVKDVVGIDNDPIALRVAGGNFRHNGVKVRLSRKPLSGIKGLFSIVVANIQSNALISLLPDLIKKVRPNGFLVLSGILAEEADGVKGAFLKSGLKAPRTLRMKEWAALVMRKI
ncbi:MAG: 50S ribosomal protein L11 methyltransferase [Deltaproteobacteria bacterium]|nr:50S ribosomal protein L11 methyltransferase [Deltaproteobacteria bacterium]